MAPPSKGKSFQIGTAVPQKRKCRTETSQFTWIGIDTIDLKKKKVKLNCDDGSSEWIDPFTSLTTAGAMERLVSYLKNTGKENTSEEKLKPLEDWIQELERYHSRYVKQEEKDYAPDEDFAFCCSVCRCSQDEFGTVSSGNNVTNEFFPAHIYSCVQST